jgi:hypothetical protein
LQKNKFPQYAFTFFIVRELTQKHSMETSRKPSLPFVVKILMLMALVAAGSLKNKFTTPKEPKHLNVRQGALTPLFTNNSSTSSL